MSEEKYTNSHIWLRRHKFCTYKGCIDNKRCMRSPCLSKAKHRWLVRERFSDLLLELAGKRDRPSKVLAVLKVAERYGYFDDPFLVTIRRAGDSHDVTDRLTKK